MPYIPTTHCLSTEKNSTVYTWYTHPVSRNTGMPYGEAMITPPSTTNASTDR